MPPPSLSTTTMRRSAARRRSAVRAPPSWTNAMSPTTATVARRPSATPSAVDTTPSMPLAPRLACALARRPAEPLEVADGIDDGDDELGAAGEVRATVRATAVRSAVPPGRARGRWSASAGVPRRSIDCASGRHPYRGEQRRRVPAARWRETGDDAVLGSMYTGPPICTSGRTGPGDPLGQDLRRRRSADAHDDIGTQFVGEPVVPQEGVEGADGTVERR